MASWIFSSLLLLWPLSQLLLFRRWLPLLFLCCCCHCCFCCTWSPVLWSHVYTDSWSAFVSEFWLCLCCCLAVTAAVLSLLLLSVTSSAPITSSRQGKTTQEANFCTGRRVVSQPIYQVTKLCSYNQRMGVCLNHSKPGIQMKVCFIPIAALSFQHLSQQSHQEKCSLFCLCWKWLQGHLEFTEDCEDSKRTDTNWNSPG